MPISHYDTVTRKFQKADKKSGPREVGIVILGALILIAVLVGACALGGLILAGVLGAIFGLIGYEAGVPFLNLWGACALVLFLLAWIAGLFKNN